MPPVPTVPAPHWKFLPGWVKNKAVNMVIVFIVKYIH